LQPRFSAAFAGAKRAVDERLFSIELTIAARRAQVARDT
jgi:hypothetical protein